MTNIQANLGLVLRTLIAHGPLRFGDIKRLSGIDHNHLYSVLTARAAWFAKRPDGRWMIEPELTQEAIELAQEVV